MPSPRARDTRRACLNSTPNPTRIVRRIPCPRSRSYDESQLHERTGTVQGIRAAGSRLRDSLRAVHQAGPRRVQRHLDRRFLARDHPARDARSADALFPGRGRSHGLPRAHAAPDALPVQGQRQLLVVEGRRTRWPRTPSGPTRTPIATRSRFAATSRSIATRSPPCTRATRRWRSCTRAATPCMATRSPGWLIEEAWKAGSPEALMGAVLRVPPRRRLSDRAVHRHHSHAASADLRHRARLARRCRRRAGRLRAARHPAAAAVRRTVRSPRSSAAPAACAAISRTPTSSSTFPILRDLRADGATDYVAMPFRFSDGQINVVSMTSFSEGRLFHVAPRQHLRDHAGTWPPVRGPCAEAHLGQPPRNLPGAQHGQACPRRADQARGRTAHSRGDLVLRPAQFDEPVGQHGHGHLPRAPQPVLRGHGRLDHRAWRRDPRLHRRRGARDLSHRRWRRAVAELHDARRRRARRRLPRRGRRPSASPPPMPRAPTCRRSNTGSGSTSAT